MQYEVRVRGWREAVSALRKVEGNLGKDFQNEVKEIAEPVRTSAISRISRYTGVSKRVRTHVIGRGVFVRQNARKVTGKRADFGRLQQRRFDEALNDHSVEIPQKMEKVLDKYIDDAGLG